MPKFINKDFYIPRLVTLLKSQVLTESHNREQMKSIFFLSEKAIAANSGEHDVLRIYFESFIEHLEKQSLTRAQFDSALKCFCDSAKVKEILLDLKDRLTSWLDGQLDGEFDEQMRLAFNPEMIKNQAKIWVEDEFSPVDERVSKSEAKKIRRFDSATRLLTPTTSISVCTALTIDVSCDEPELLIGANVSEQGTQDELLEIIQKRVAILKNYFSTVQPLDKQAFDNKQAYNEALKDELHAHAMNLFALLYPEINNDKHKNQSNTWMIQAAMKLIHAVCYDDSTFSAKEKQVFLPSSPYRVLMPCKNERMFMLTFLITPNTVDRQLIELGTVPQSAEVKDIHAEQLLTQYLFVQKQIPIDTPIAIGVSRLCCSTCFERMLDFPGVTVRGQHGQAYPNVVNLGDGTSPTKSLQRRATTFAWPSPGDTPYKSKKDSSTNSSPSKPPSRLESPSRSLGSLFNLAISPERKPPNSARLSGMSRRLQEKFAQIEKELLTASIEP